MTNVTFQEYPDGFFAELNYSIVELAEFSEGDVVTIDPGGTSVITSLMTSNFSFPTGEEETEDIEASEDDPKYVVATKSGMRVVSEDEVSEDSFNTDADPKKLANGAELSDVYKELDNPYSMEELINIPGVDDPHVGFDELPEGWDRLSVLDAWSSLGGTFTSCRADMAGEIRSPTRFCAALKDEVLQTEQWRNRF